MKRTSDKFELPVGYKEEIERRAENDCRDIHNEFGGVDFTMFMQRIERMMRLQAGYEPRLRDLAEESIRFYYGSILDDVELIIKYPDTQQEIPQDMEDTPDEPPKDPDMELISDRDVILEIKKRKIANCIIQGEAKNTKLILNDTFIRDRMIQIYGQETGQEMIRLLTEITKIAGFFDWKVPMDMQQEAWQEDKSRMAGCVSVDWKPEDDKEEEEENEEEDTPYQEPEDVEDEDEFTPQIKAIGKDFGMLMHESVKGIYELIAANGIPENEDIANKVISNTDTLNDELLDLRYGPYIAGDFRDYINSFSEVDNIDNLRERVFGKIVSLPAEDFLDLMELIFNKDERANSIVQDLINDIDHEIKAYEAELMEDKFEEESIIFDDGEYDEDIEEREESLASELEAAAGIIQQEEEATVSVEDMTNSEIQAEIDYALDNSDFATVERLAPYLK
jgi:hypothetical protein